MFSEQARAEGVTKFIGSAAGKFCVLPGKAEIIEICVEPGDERERTGDIAAPKGGFANPLVVKNAEVDFDGLSEPGIRPPLAEPGQHSRGIEREAVIR